MRPLERSPAEPLFLARRTYRRRRLIDAIRFLPILGALMFLIPVLKMSTGTGTTFAGGVYLFSAWLGLIMLTGVLSYLVRRFDSATANDEGGTGDSTGGARD